MPLIQILSPHVANQIAAGEVVERPCSVVKELVENAVDAGATAVNIEIENGGIDRITIVDNGCGIPDAECETAFLRHATSKITTADDLASIHTLGFRGEALASIASVARVTMKTHTASDELGTEIVYDGGVLSQHRRIGCPEGTTLDVKDLFYNVPARRKFLRSPRAEAGAVGDYVARLILSLPQISFRYSANGNTVYRTSGDNELRNAIVAVYGVSAANHLCPVRYDDGYLKIDGYIGTPELSRPNRTGQTIVLNGRVIRSASLSAAMARAFDTRLMGGRYPFAVLHMHIAPQEADVNVHPAKLEVHFANESRVTQTVYISCSEALTRAYVPSARAVTPPATADDGAARPAGSFRTDVPTMPARGFSATTAPRVDLRASGMPHSTFSVREGGADGAALPRYTLPQRNVPAHVQESILSPDAESPLAKPYRIIGQAFSTYWIVQQDDALYLIDQHAAHERLLYDALTQKKLAIVSQALFVPEEIVLSPSDMALFAEKRKSLEAFGFVFSLKNETTLQLIAVPQVNGTPMRAAFLLDTLHDAAPDKARLMQTACKHAVKAGEPITQAEIETLLSALNSGDSLLTCPHGRPVCVRLTKLEIEKLFKRVL